VVAHSTHNATLADATLASEKKTLKPRAATSKKYARDAFLQLRIYRDLFCWRHPQRTTEADFDFFWHTEKKK